MNNQTQFTGHQYQGPRFGDEVQLSMMNAAYNQINVAGGPNYPFLSNPEEPVWRMLVSARSSHAVCEMILEQNSPVSFSQIMARRFENPQLVFDCLPVMLTRLLEPQRIVSLHAIVGNGSAPSYGEVTTQVAEQIKELLDVKHQPKPGEQLIALREALQRRYLIESTQMFESGQEIISIQYQALVEVIQSLVPLFRTLGLIGPVTCGPLVLFENNKFAEELSLQTMEHYLVRPDTFLAAHLFDIVTRNADWVESEIIALIRNIPSTKNHHPSAVGESNWCIVLTDLEKEIGRDALLGLFHCAFMRTYG